jgi:hypothetical protein
LRSKYGCGRSPRYPDLFKAPHRALARGHDLDLPALLGGVALVHAEQIAGEQRRLVAACAGADFEYDVALVHGVLGKERQTQPLFERRPSRFKLGLFRLGDGAHLAIGRGIFEQACDPVKFALRSPIRLHRFDDRGELGELA